MDDEAIRNLEDRGSDLRQTFLKFPNEESFVDYKAAQAFVQGDDFSLKLIKHILGMANSGGGYIVIGYKENDHGQPEAETIDPQITASYDTSKLAECVEKYTAGTDRINLIVHKDKNRANGLTYPVIEVKGFEKRPFFCKSDKRVS